MPREGHDFLCFPIRLLFPISIHVPREGHDIGLKINRIIIRRFQSTCPARGTTTATNTRTARHQNFNPRAPRGARLNVILVREITRNFNPRAPRGARLSDVFADDSNYLISIHVPREGHDSFLEVCDMARFYFNPRAPRGARHRRRYQVDETSKFQSTCPARGTTEGSPSIQRRASISIHVPREGHDSTWLLS